VNPVPPLRVVDLTASAAPVQAPVAVVRRSLGEQPFAGPPLAPPPRAAGPGTGPSTLPAALRDVEGVRARLDDMLAQARRGRTFTPQELLCLQADAHRFAQTVELAGRAVEHGVQGLRQALNAQV